MVVLTNVIHTLPDEFLRLETNAGPMSTRFSSLFFLRCCFQTGPRDENWCVQRKVEARRGIKNCRDVLNSCRLVACYVWGFKFGSPRPPSLQTGARGARQMVKGRQGVL